MKRSTRAGILFMRLLAPLPLGIVRAIGWVFGQALYLVAAPRRRVVGVNLGLCFPGESDAWRRRVARRSFVRFSQAWLDRSWLWHGDAARTQKRLRITGVPDALAGSTPTVIFAPHFYGLDAGWTALAGQLPRRMTTIFTPQRNKGVDAWIHAGRMRFGDTRLFDRNDGVKPIVSALREGAPLYLLPDMNFGPEESVFVPFYGVQAATVPSLSRFAKLGRAQVVAVTTRMTADGYDVEVHAPWADFPSADAVADTALMNQRLESLIDTMPEQYYWVHKRFKTRPPGERRVY